MEGEFISKNETVSDFVSFQQVVSLHLPPEGGAAHAEGICGCGPVLGVLFQDGPQLFGLFVFP